MKNLYIIFFSLITSFSYGQQINSITTLSTPNCNGPGAFEQVEIDLSGLMPIQIMNVVAYTGNSPIFRTSNICCKINQVLLHLIIQILIKEGYMNFICMIAI